MAGATGAAAREASCVLEKWGGSEGLTVDGSDEGGRRRGEGRWREEGVSRGGMVSVFTACVESQTWMKSRWAGPSRTERMGCGQQRTRSKSKGAMESGMCG